MDFKGEGKAVLYSNVPFDREAQKQYIVPVVIRDSGYPSLSATASLTVSIGDLNDHEMKDGFKDVTVYCISQEDSYGHMQRYISFTYPFTHQLSSFPSLASRMIYYFGFVILILPLPICFV